MTLPLADGDLNGRLGSDEAAYIFGSGAGRSGWYVMRWWWWIVGMRNMQFSCPVFPRFTLAELKFWSLNSTFGTMVPMLSVWQVVPWWSKQYRVAGRSPGWLSTSQVVLADKPDKPTLNANLVRAEDAGLVRGVCRFQCDRAPFRRRRFSVAIPVHERDHDFSLSAVSVRLMSTTSPSGTCSIIEIPDFHA